MKISITTKSADYLFGFMSLQMPAINAAELECMDKMFTTIEPIVVNFQQKRNDVLSPAEGLQHRLKQHVNIGSGIKEGPENSDEENEKIRENDAKIKEISDKLSELDKIVTEMREEMVEVELTDEFVELLRGSVNVYFGNNKPNERAPYLTGVLGRMDSKCLNEILQAIA